MLIKKAKQSIASCDLIKMVKILYSVDEGKKQQTIADFEKELRK